MLLFNDRVIRRDLRPRLLDGHKMAHAITQISDTRRCQNQHRWLLTARLTGP